MSERGDKSGRGGPAQEDGLPEIEVVGEPEAETGSFLRSGTVLDGGYEIVRLLGAGGMGRVFVARDRKLGREVAVKIMREGLRAHEERKVLAKRFADEAMLPAGIHHPNIIAIHDRGQVGGLDFFVMEYIPEADTLRDAIDQAREKGEMISLADVASYVSQTAKGLIALHPRFWHRDIKLSNLLRYPLAEGGYGVKLIDFGIVHRPGSQLTEIDVVPGTPANMSPECFDFSKGPPQADFRTDLFALGCVAYELLTLEHPFPQIKTWHDCMAVFASDYWPTPPSARRPDVGPAWDQWIRRLLERRDKRYQSAAEALAAMPQPSAPLAMDRDLTRPDFETPDILRPAPASPAAASSAATETPTRDIRGGAAAASRADRAQSGDENANVAAKKEATPAPGPVPPSSPAPSGDDLSDVPGSTSPKESSGPKVGWLRHAAEEDDHAKSRVGRRLRIAAMVAAGLLAVVGGLIFVTDSMRSGRTPEAKDGWTFEPGRQQGAAEEWIEDTREAKPLLRSSSVGDIAAPGPTAGADQSAHAAAIPVGTAIELPPDAREATSPRQQQRKSARRSERPAPGGTGTPSAGVDDSVDPAWAAVYGAKQRNLSGGVVTIRPGVNDSGSAVEVKGQRLSVYLLDDAASTPQGAPVVAKLAKPAELGRHRIEAGTEIHGKVRGSQGPRVFIDFTFIRLPDKTTLPIKGTAKGQDGRLGVPGKRLVDEGTAISVGAAGAGAAAREVAGAAAELVGDALGSETIREIGSEGADKAKLLDSEEALVVAKRGTVFVVYLDAMPEMPK